jgi:hypothetical protein
MGRSAYNPNPLLHRLIIRRSPTFFIRSDAVFLAFFRAGHLGAFGDNGCGLKGEKPRAFGCGGRHILQDSGRRAVWMVGTILNEKGERASKLTKI